MSFITDRNHREILLYLEDELATEPVAPLPSMHYDVMLQCELTGHLEATEDIMFEHSSNAQMAIYEYGVPGQTYTVVACTNPSYHDHDERVVADARAHQRHRERAAWDTYTAALAARAS